MADNRNGHRQRLRARFLKTGLRGFAEHEVLELILTLCIPRRDVKDLAKALLKKFGSIRNVLDADSTQLQTFDGLGEASAVCFSLLKAFAEYYLKQKTVELPIFTNNASLVQFWQSRLGSLKYEVFEIAYLDAAYRLMKDGIERLEEGAGTCTKVYLQKVLRSALTRGAVNFVLAHNHPSGNAQPSQTDLQITQSLHYACTLINIRFLDHIIIAKDGYYSFRQSGFLA